MENNVYKLLDELHAYTSDPNRKVFASVEIEHINAVLGTLLAVYREDAPITVKESGEARRPPQRPLKRSWWQQLLP